MSCKCKNIIENFKGGTIPLNTTFLRDVDVLGNIYSGGTNLLDIFSGSTGGGSFTGNTSGTCINDLYVSNIYGCSPLTVGTDLTVSGNSIFGGNISLGDDNIINVGDDDELQIFHNGSNNNTVIQETGVGNLVIKGSNLFLQSSGSEDFFRGVANGAVTLYYDNVPKFETTADGVDVIGSILSGGTDLLNIFPTSDTFVTGGTVNNGILTLERNDSNSIQINRVNSGFFAQTGDSTTVSGTTDELTLLGSGVGSLSVPANTFQIGDSYALNMGGKLRTNNAGQSITIRVDAISGSSRVEIATTGVILLDNINALRDFVLEVEFTIRNTGGPGTASLMTSGYFDYVKNNGDLEGVLFSSLESTNFDTTVTKTLDVTVEWGASSTDNQIYSHIAILRKIF